MRHSGSLLVYFSGLAALVAATYVSRLFRHPAIALLAWCVVLIPVWLAVLITCLLAAQLVCGRNCI